MAAAGFPRRWLAGAFVALALLPCQAATAEPGFEARRDATLAAQLARPFPSPACRVPSRGEDRCAWGEITRALALLQTQPAPGAAAQANALLREAVARLPNSAGWKRLPDPRQPEAEGQTAAVRDFPFLTATLLFRAVAQFAPRLDSETERGIRALFQDWAGTECRPGDADPALVWLPWSSENHDIQRVHTCWAAAELARQPAQQAAWVAYLKTYIRARAATGVTVEFFSPTYAKYFLGPFHNMRDFSADAELRALAGEFVTLWWGLWAQEQIGGQHGGARTRFYPTRQESPAPLAGLPWVYFGLGERSPEAAHPAHLPMLLSGWRPAPVLRALAEAGAERGSYEVWTRQLGLVAGPRQGPRTPLLADTSALSRYAHVTPDYVMGSILAPRLPMARWTTISSQNRWHGVTLAGGPGAVLFALPVPRNGRTSYNATLAAQSRGTQIIQRLEPPFSRGAGELLIQAGAGLRLVERGGWVFAEAGGYVAARAAFGGQVAEGGGYRPLDPRAPVIIQAGTRATYRGFAAFQAAVLAAPLRVTAGFVEFEGLEGAGRLRAYLDSDRPPERDGQPLHAPEGWSLHSPFLRQRLGERLVEISHGGQRLTLRF